MTQQYSNVLMLQNSLNKKLSNNKKLLIKGQTFFITIHLIMNLATFNK